MTVLVVTHSQDNDAPGAVIRAIEERGGRAYRLDTDFFPTDLAIVLHEHGRGLVRGPQGALDLAEVSAIWYRRNNTGGRIPRDMDLQLRAPAVEESRRVIHGLMAALDVFALDRVDVVRRAEQKPLQLRLARAAGLEVPRTLTTNDPDEVRAFARKCPGGLISKMMASFAVYDGAGKEHVVFTNPLSDADLADLDGLDLCPMTFQERLEKFLELRVIVAGDRVMTAAIDPKTLPRAASDWRREGVALLDRWTGYDLPGEVSARILALMDALGLNYGALDFIVTPEGRHVFLEINPAGEFMWLMHHPGLPIAGALADVLLGRARRRSL